MVPIIGDSELIVADSCLTPICTKLGSSLPGGSNSPGTRVVDSVPMKSAMEWHDSELFAIDAASASEGAILLDAYVHWKVEEAGDTAVEGGNQRVKISVRSMRFQDFVPEMPTDIYRGVLVLGGMEHNDLVRLPMRFEGEVRLILTMLDDGRELPVSGTGTAIEER
jgi:hypothetical protein